MEMLYKYDPEKIISIFSLHGKGQRKPYFNQNSLYACCPFPHPRPGEPNRRESNPSFWISLADGRWGCYSCRKGGSDLNGLAFRLGLELPYLPRVSSADLKKSTESDFELRPHHYDMLQMHPEIAGAYLKSRGISPEMADIFHLGASRDGAVIYFPLLDRKGFYGWIERHTGEGETRWTFQPPGVERTRIVYYPTEGIFPEGSIVVVESTMDAIRLASWGVFAVATCSAVVTSPQLEKILDFAPEISVIRQNDAPGEKWEDRVLKYFAGRCSLYCARLPSQYKDICDLPSVTEYSQAFSERKAVRVRTRT